MDFKLWLENQIPGILYHHSLPHHRQSILQFGLQGKYDQTVDLTDPDVVGGIFLTNKPKQSKSDVWEVNVQGLPVEEDWSGQPEASDETWYVVYQDIPPNRIKLLSR